MKKFVSFFIISILFVYCIFSKNFFSTRYFESKLELPYSISNNVFSLNDFLVKDLVIDLPKIADSVPENGYESVFLLQPNLSSKITIGDVSFGSKFCIDMYGKVNVPKEIFDLCFKGYNVGETVEFNLEADMDVFSYMDFPIDVKIRQFKFNLTPTVFLPLASLENAFTKASFYNDNDGNIKATLHNNYSLLISSGIYNVNKDRENEFYPFLQIKDNKLLGFDLSCSFEFPIFRKLNLLVAGRFPIIPGRLNQRLLYLNQESNLDAPSIIELLYTNESGNKKAKTEENNSREDDGVYESGEYLETYGNGFEMEKLTEPVLVNRPCKLNAYVIYEPFSAITLVAGGGIVVKHAFDSYDVSCYPEYYGGATLNLFDVLKATLSTEYTDQIFRHQLTGVLNLRFIELDIGISIEATDFLKSFNFYGLGAKVGIVSGF